MRRLRCPRCSASVTVEEGERPECAECGFGQPAAPEPVAAPPKKRRVGLIVTSTILGLVLVLAGVAAALYYTTSTFDGLLGGEDEMTEAEARQRTGDAIAVLGAGEDDPPAAMNGMRLDARIENVEDAGTVRMEGSFEFGLQGGVHFVVTLSALGLSYTIEEYCDDTKRVLVVGEETAEERPPRDGESCLSDDGEEDDLFGDVEWEDALDAVAEAESHHDLEDLQVTIHDDQSITATFTDGGDGNLTASVDPDGRLAWLEGRYPDGYTNYTFQYGEREAVVFPATDQRMPAGAEGFGQFFDGAYRWQGIGGEEEKVPLGEFEVRVRDPDSNRTIAAFDPGGSATQTQQTFLFEFEDDGDGFLGANDTFTIRSDAWTSGDQYDVVVWDTWADREIGDNPIPWPGLWLLLAAFALVALLRRR